MDLGGTGEDERIGIIGDTAMRGTVVAFVVEDNEKADRYVAKLADQFPAVQIIDRFVGPLANTVTVRVSGPKRFNYRSDQFPIRFEALHPKTRAVVWSQVLERPDDLAMLAIPPLKKQLGHSVVIRVLFGDGTVEESSGTETIQ